MHALSLYYYFFLCCKCNNNNNVLTWTAYFNVNVCKVPPCWIIQLSISLHPQHLRPNRDQEWNPLTLLYPFSIWNKPNYTILSIDSTREEVVPAISTSKLSTKTPILKLWMRRSKWTDYCCVKITSSARPADSR